MIFEKLVSILLGIVDAALGLFPAWTEPTVLDGLENAAYDVGDALRIANLWVDVPVLLALLTLGMAIVLADLTVRVVRWVYGLIPGKAS